MKARFITFEGGEGSGKSTQAKRLADQLRSHGRDVLVTREPGGSPFAEAVREIILTSRLPPHAPLSEALLFYAARADHLEAVIRPALAAGRWVLCDRFSDSTRVYQGLAGHIPASAIEALERVVVARTKPDLTLMIDVPVEVGLARANRRRDAGAEPSAADRYEGREVDFHERLRQGFLELARAEPQRCIVIDGARPEEEVAADVWTAVRSRTKLKAS